MFGYPCLRRGPIVRGPHLTPPDARGRRPPVTDVARPMVVCAVAASVADIWGTVECCESKGIRATQPDC